MSFIELDPTFFADTPLDFDTRERRPRVICSIDGKDKSGKSDFCYDAPDPIGVLSFDFGDEDVVQKFQEDMGRQIAIADFKWQIPPELHAIKGEELAKWITTNVWLPSVELYRKMLTSGQFRTIVIDKATEWWQICRLGVFGRLATNRQDYQTEANSRWREIIREASVSEHPVNLMLIHEQKEEWIVKTMAGKEPGTTEEKWAKSGVWIRDGNEKVPFLIQHGLELRFIKQELHPVNKQVLYPARFEAEVMVARGHPEQIGTVFTLGEHNLESGKFDREAGWLDIMSTLRPEIPLEDWGHALVR